MQYIINLTIQQNVICEGSEITMHRTLLTYLREKEGWKQDELAEVLNVSQQTISLIETGKRNPSIKLAKKYEILFQKSMEELFPDIFLDIKTTKCNRVSKPA